jgi:hypothetical protein
MSGTNPNTPRGLVPYAYSWGAPYNGAVDVFYVPSSYGSAIYVGDPVVFTQNSADAQGVPVVTLASAGSTNKITGVMVGVANNANELILPVLQSSPVYLPASSGGYVYVASDPNLLFWAQEDSVGGSMAYTSGGGNLASLVSGAGSTYTGLSGWQIQSSSVGTGTQVAIMRPLPQVDNVVSSTITFTNAKWLIRIVQRLPTF